MGRAARAEIRFALLLIVLTHACDVLSTFLRTPDLALEASPLYLYLGHWGLSGWPVLLGIKVFGVIVSAWLYAYYVRTRSTFYPPEPDQSFHDFLHYAHGVNAVRRADGSWVTPLAQAPGHVDGFHYLHRQRRPRLLPGCAQHAQHRVHGLDGEWGGPGRHLHRRRHGLLAYPVYQLPPRCEAAVNRRRFLRIAAAGAAGLAGGAVALQTGECTWDLGLTRLQAPVPRLPQALDGLRIAHVSDLHCGPHVPAEFAARALRMIREASADLIVLTGDFVSQDGRNLGMVRSALRSLAAPLGVYACLGNHDYHRGRAPLVTAELNAAGVRVLENASLPLRGAEGLWLTGLADPASGRHDLSTALRDVPSEACKLLIAHAPDMADEAADRRVDFAMVGHTHGGQISLPFIGPPIVPSRYGSRFASGLFDLRGFRMFVSRGVGVVMPGVRYFCPPEVALITLRRADWQLSSGGYAPDLRPFVRFMRRVLPTHRPG